MNDSSIDTPRGEPAEEDILEQLKRIQTLDRNTFLELYSDYLDHSYQFQKIRTILHVEMKLRPESGRAERQVIENVLDGNMNVHDYIKINMSAGKIFYIINKKFWDQWLEYS